MTEELEEMILHYLTDMAERGDDEAKILIKLILEAV
jgi:hypothetical protein